MSTQALQALLAELEGSVIVDDGKVSVADENTLRGKQVDTLANKAVFGTPEEQAASRWLCGSWGK